MRGAPPTVIAVAAVVLQTLFAWLVLSGLEAPLLWQDEAETAGFGRRVIAYGYPKVGDERGGELYTSPHPRPVGVREGLDAYVASPWGQYFFAAPAVAWSDAAPAADLAARTRRVRLPFALAGWLGVVLLGAAAARAWPGRSRAAFWLGFGALLAPSVLLQLHLREVRYYPLVVLGVGAVAWLEAGRLDGRLRRGPSGLLLAGVLWTLFNLFYPAFGVLALGAVLALAGRAWRAPGPGRWAALVRDAAPYLGAGLAALPMAVFYRIPAQAHAYLDPLGDPLASWAARAADAVHYLLRWEWLGPALVGAAGLAWLRRAAASDPALRPARLAVGLGLGLAALWVALVSRTPEFYERYHVALSPVLAAVCALEAGLLAALRRGAPDAAARRRAGLALAALALAGLGSLALRAPELRGRWAELREPYRGPLDHAIPHLLARHPDPAALVIATNYEGPSYAFYLGAQAWLGFYERPDASDFDALARPPDVIVPRPWGVNLRALQRLAGQAAYAPVPLPVGNLKANNVPSLSPRNRAGLVHRFASPPADGPYGPLILLERREEPSDGEPAVVRPPGAG